MHLSFPYSGGILMAALIAVVSCAPQLSETGPFNPTIVTASSTSENSLTSTLATDPSSAMSQAATPTPSAGKTSRKSKKPIKKPRKGASSRNAVASEVATPAPTRAALAMVSPTYLPSFDEPDEHSEFHLDVYPERWKIPPADHAEIQAAMQAINWDHVPDIPVRSKNSEGGVDISSASSNDEGCWWSASGCTKPKVDYLPEDVSMCSKPGDWGLTFDDGPLNPRPEYQAKGAVDPLAAPALYDYLAKSSQSATMFYVGSNVATHPKAALRAYHDGHDLCVHTWSHPAMTTLTNEQVVGELYWTLRAIKEAAGITPRCWRPPFGDVDDRVRAIAHQLGLATILWDRDSQDWQMPSEFSKEGKLDPSSVDALFAQWIADRKGGNDTEHGHLGLQHELNDATMAMTEKWLPQLQQVFNVKPAHACVQQGSAHWETFNHDDQEDDHDEDNEDDDDHNDDDDDDQGDHGHDHSDDHDDDDDE